MDWNYYERVATRMARMKDGECFDVIKHTTAETKDKFLKYFSRFAFLNNTKYTWWDFDGTIIQCHYGVSLKNILKPAIKDLPHKVKSWVANK